MLQEVPVDQITVNERLRQLDQSKVLELAESIQNIGLINPITLDTDFNLIAGNHRLAAIKQLGHQTIKAMVCDSSDLIKELIEIDENLIRKELCYISIGEHLSKRERILTSLGKRKQRGENQHTTSEDRFSTDDLAEKLGISKRIYQYRRQVSNLIPEVRNVLRGSNYANNLVDLVLLSRTEDHIQKQVAYYIKNGSTKTLKFLIQQSKVDFSTKTERSASAAKLKESWGTPFSIMKFEKKKSNAVEMAIKTIADAVNQNKDAHINGTDYPNYNGFINHSIFLLDYFVRNKGAKVLDNFCGKGTNLFAASLLGMEPYGFDLNQKNLDAIEKGFQGFFNDDEVQHYLFNEDGVTLPSFKDQEEFFDAVVTDPPYINANEIYTDHPDDLSNLNTDTFMERMDILFRHYYRLIKTSQVKEKKFYPVMMKMNISRRGTKGVFSMDYDLMKIAEKNGFTLWDRTYNILNPTLVAFTLPRTVDNFYTVKNYETTLIWIKQV